MTLKGQLQHFGLAELFQTLALNQHTGTLVVEHKDETKSIYFATGSISFVSTGGGKSIRLGEILRRQGRISEEEIESALQEQASSGNLLGRVLIERGLITVDDVQAALRTKVQEELYDLFLWEEGTFEFRPDFCPPELMDPLQRHTQISIDPQAILMEGLRQLDEVRVVQTHIADLRVVVKRTTDRLPDDCGLDQHEKQVWTLTEDTTSVIHILKSSEETRFQTLRLLHRFIESGWLRALHFEEYSQRIQEHLKQREDSEASQLFEFLLEVEPAAKKDPEFLGQAGQFFYDSGEKERAGGYLLESMRLYQGDGCDQQAWEVGASILRRGVPSLDLLRSLWRLREHGQPKQKTQIREALVARLREGGHHDQVEEFLAEQVEELGKTPKYWIDRADACRQLGSPAEAIEHYEQSLKLLSEKKHLSDVVRIHRMIFDLDPSRADVKKRLQELMALAEKAEAKKSKKFSVIGGVCIALVVVAVIPIRYELKARELFERARLVERANADASDFAEARELYATITEKYRLSSQADPARERITQLKAAEIQYRKAEQDRIAREQDAERQARLERVQAAQRLIYEARQAEEEGRLDQARKYYELLLGEYAPLIDTQKIRFPLLIQSSPKGAKLFIDDTEVGETPFLHHYEPGTSLKLRASRSGCLDQEVTYKDEGDVRLLITLPRSPLGEAQFPTATDGAPTVMSGRMLVPCRDGWVYCFPDASLDLGEALWRRQIGTFGHPSPWIRKVGSVALISSISGTIDLVTIDNGEALWTLSLDCPLTAAPVVNSDRKYIAAGCEDGTVILIDAQKGREVARLKHDFPIIDVQFVGKRLWVLNRRRAATQHSLPNLETIAERQFSKLPRKLLEDGSVLLASGLLEQKSLPAPTTSILETEGGIAYGSRDRQWVWFSRGELRSGYVPGVPSAAPLIHEQLAYVGTEDGRVHCADPEGVVQWSLAVPGRVTGIIPAAKEGHLLVVLSNGRVLLIQGGLE